MTENKYRTKKQIYKIEKLVQIYLENRKIGRFGKRTKEEVKISGNNLRKHFDRQKMSKITQKNGK